jgi:hypothetical protein
MCVIIIIIIVQCSLNIRGACVPRLTANSENPRIIDAPTLVTPLSEKHFLSVSVQCSIEVRWLISSRPFFKDIFLLLNANKIKISEIDQIIYYQICQRI